MEVATIRDETTGKPLAEAVGCWKKLVEAERAGSLMINGQSAASPHESA